MELTAAIALVTALINGIQKAIAAGSTTLTDADVDTAVAELDASDTRLSDAIARARAREADNN